MATKKNRNRENWPFWSKFERFDREINIEHKQIPKKNLTEDESYQGTQYIKRGFLVLSCADI